MKMDELDILCIHHYLTVVTVVSCESMRLPDSQHLCGRDSGAELDPNICNKTQLRKQRQSFSWSRHANHVSQ